MTFQQVMMLLGLVGGIWLYVERHTDTIVARNNEVQNLKIQVLSDRIDRLHP